MKHSRATSSLTIISSLPDPLPEGVAYTVPAAIKVDAGNLLAYVSAICFGDDNLRLSDHFGVSRQTFWNWRKKGNGVPEKHRRKVEELLANPGNTQFRLPTNSVIDDVIRSARKPSVPMRQAKPNYHLIDLLHRICAAENMGFGTLNTIISQMSRPVSNPSVFYLWAWSLGGVPRSYVSAFMTALMQLRIYELYDFSQFKSTTWLTWAEREFIAIYKEDH